ncbi:hypothetical protein TNCT_342041 [Trichonephila clavata]|uniref:Uncharacterized protein n=1 Tax=Trichonephila clavata TaxID=2740835 RepID=A0A8X6LXQ7_TRICU|nr:hypothetical protein TNCT_342041 [Trichonephila clavata]
MATQASIDFEGPFALLFSPSLPRFQMSPLKLLPAHSVITIPGEFPELPFSGWEGHSYGMEWKLDKKKIPGEKGIWGFLLGNVGEGYVL